MTPEGLLIRNVSRQDEGGYICRARVSETGQLEERVIQLEVNVSLVRDDEKTIVLQIRETPIWLTKPADKTFLEGKNIFPMET